jgi:hypothetical protein
MRRLLITCRSFIWRSVERLRGEFIRAAPQMGGYVLPTSQYHMLVKQRPGRLNQEGDVSRTQPILVVLVMALVVAGLIGYVSASASRSQDQSRSATGVPHRHTPLFD